ncbi:MAG: phosphopantetheine-binding protein [Planctomycetota bacterium]|nr:phosphopantetheine-binding protein [Planctomycetota bacterium]
MSSTLDPPFQVITNLVVNMTQVDPSKIRRSSRLIDFGLDSVRAMELIAELEDHYDLSIPDEDVMEIETVDDIARYIDRRRSQS